ncbi:hypothetical protein CLV59_109260 [Chitinophaga dinghuensis]|uniref:Uncharacterized protein n=1 Tax=Chitinophaga dinghuensis TaxID=1539050 RepID=A0A327VPF0_9BACT|nr:hypothetical protein [Chitinophaga dinghuensis]RAJ75646.1 hypothetical protein CLV59_109260 [Chitinophaga dinghuensis]
MKKITILIACLFFGSVSFAQISGNTISIMTSVYIYSSSNAILFRLTKGPCLVTHYEIRAKVAEGYFKALNLNAIPQNNQCITTNNAKAWLSLAEEHLPKDGRLPTWVDLIPKNP